MADYALNFDGSQNYVSLSTMGNFGANLGSGLYWSFQIKTNSTAKGEFGTGVSNGVSVIIGFNEDQNGSTINGKLMIFFVDKNNNAIQAATSSATNFNNGNNHTIEIDWTSGNNTIVIKLDGASQTLSYKTQGTPSTFQNFTWNFCLAARTFGSNTPGNFFACTLDNFQIGTSSSVLYGNYGFNEGTGTTTADVSGQGNTGTLTGSPLPVWVTGLNAYGNVTGRFNF